MSDNANIDYGPLVELIGVWRGDKGLDVAPEPGGAEHTPYYETITFTAIGDVTNAEVQTLAVLHYRQIVQRKADDSVFHDETGYWMWDANKKIIMHSLTIPRAVNLLAGAEHNGQKESDGNYVLAVTAGIDDPDWAIIQSPFMKDNARTISFHQRLSVGNGKLSYTETMIIDIYGKKFTHTDNNELIRQ